jgi:phosphoribosylformylglycinamidine cyclo-ligase
MLVLAQDESKTEWKEMYKVFNMGHRMEVYLAPDYAEEVIKISKHYNIEAKIVGRVEAFEKAQVTIKSEKGTFSYVKGVDC